MMAWHSGERRSTEFRRRHHTSSIQLAEIANEVKPRLLATYHRSHAGEQPTESGHDVLIEEIRRNYKGHVVAANDLDIF